MGTVLFAWQLGGGLGHLLRMLPLAEGLVKEGHRVFMAFRDLGRAGEIYGQAGVRFLQAPFRSRGRLFFPRTMGFAHLLANVGFWDRRELFGLASAWRNLYRLIRPDLIVFDHSPVALLAARGMAARRALIGTGFFCPPDVCPLPVISSRVDAEVETAKLIADEEQMVGGVNWVLEHWQEGAIERLGQLYGEVDERFLTTFPELDHYGERKDARYWGPVMGCGGKVPEWPGGRGTKRIYAYLKAFTGLEELLECLNDRGDATLVLSDGIGRRIQERYASDTLRFANERLDMARVGQECDVAILNANHATAAGLLLAGRPMLNIPLQVEQQLLGQAVSRIGAGEMVGPKGKGRTRIEEVLEQLLWGESHMLAARRFLERHRSFDRERQTSDMLERACKLVSGGPGVTQGSWRDAFSRTPVSGHEDG
ncbi:MAG: hypothetical protein NTU53_03165 [Planctomycetota bacterium]|nr:hypothetical protein [Planctomycetota bacterium]